MPIELSEYEKDWMNQQKRLMALHLKLREFVENTRANPPAIPLFALNPEEAKDLIAAIEVAVE